MIDMRKVGAFISKLRKERDMTQVELADALNVSHQAVSKWEVGDSMPDIGTLPKLAQLFDVTVDEILKGERYNHGDLKEKEEGLVVRELANGDPERIAEMIRNDELKADALVNVAPIVKSSMLEKIVDNLDSNVFSLEDIVGLAPFVRRDTLDRLIKNIYLEKIDPEHILGLAPFVSHDTLDRLLGHLEEKI